tara:strand:+ start:322 stop:666 length:345 start_codon:yes stop_codon:yes gene_type:complete
MIKQPDPINIKLGAELRRLRESRKLTQTIVANALNVTFQQIQKYEKGTNGMSASRFLQVCMFFKITPTEFATQARVIVSNTRYYTKTITEVPIERITNYTLAVNKDEKEEEKKD